MTPVCLDFQVEQDTQPPVMNTAEQIGKTTDPTDPVDTPEDDSE